MGKGFFHEPSVRVPLIVADFRAPQTRVETAPPSLLDLFPIFLDWSGAAPQAQAQGRKLSEPDHERYIAGMTTGGVMLRDTRWKLVRYANGCEALFDLQADPQEQDNVIDQHADVRQRLDTELTRSLLEGMAAGHATRMCLTQNRPPTAFFMIASGSDPIPHNFDCGARLTRACFGRQPTSIGNAVSSGSEKVHVYVDF